MRTGTGTGKAEAMETRDEAGFRLRDTRRADWFWVENVLVDVFQPVLGPFGVSIYSAMCREVRREEVRLTLREIGELAGVSKDTAARLLWRMEALAMIGRKQGGAGKRKYTFYVLYDLKDAAVAGVDALRAKLQAAELAKSGKDKAKTVVRVEENASGMLLFDEREEEPVTSSEENEEPVLVSVGDKNEVETVSQAETTLSQGDPRFVSESGGFVSHGDSVSILEKKEETKTKDSLLNPPGGGTLETKRDSPVGEVAEQESFGVVLDRLSRLKPRLGDVEDLRGQIESHMTTAGFKVRQDARIANRGDGRSGTVDMWCERGSRGEDGGPGAEFVAFELDGAVARDRSLMKLLALGRGMHRVVVLRTATVPPTYAGLTTIALGWPGNGQAERMAEAKARGEAAMARTRVGQAGASTSAASPQARCAPSGVEVRMMLGEVRETLEMYGAETLNDWDAAFELAVYERHEAVEGAAGEVLLVLSSPHPAETMRGLEVYGSRIEKAMAKRFGPRAQVQVVAWDGAISAAGEETLCLR